jgi:hypothetical protein
MRLIRIAVLLAITFSAPLVRSQASLLEDGQDGYSLLAGPFLNHDYISLQGSLVGTFSGRIDAGVLLSAIIFEQDVNKRFAAGAYVEMFLMRQDPLRKVPVSTSILLQFADAGSNYYAILGLSVYKRIRESSRSFAQPIFTITYAKDVSGSYKANYWGGSLGISISTPAGRTAIVSFTPIVSLTQNRIAGGILFGVTIPTSQMKKEQSEKFDF